MTKFENINSLELSIIKKAFNELSYLQLDMNLAYIVESYIYSIVKEYYSSKEEMEEKQIKVEYRTKYGLKDGEYKEWYNTGKLSIKCFYINDKPHGKYESWFSNGKLKTQCTYIDGMTEGIYKHWYKNVNPVQLASQYTYSNGQLNGEYKQWYQNGILWVHGNNKNNEDHGERKSWERNGILSLHHYYKDGKLDGVCTNWINGQLWSQNYYKDGKLDGEYKVWNDNNELVKHLVYQNGEVITTIVNTTINNANNYYPYL